MLILLRVILFCGYEGPVASNNGNYKNLFLGVSEDSRSMTAVQGLWQLVQQLIVPHSALAVVDRSYDNLLQYSEDSHSMSGSKTFQHSTVSHLTYACFDCWDPTGTATATSVNLY